MRWGAVLAGLALWGLPGALAAGAEGAFTAEGIVLPAGSEVELVIAGLYAPELAEGTTLAGSAARVTVERYEFGLVGQGAAQIAVENRSARYALSSVRFDLVGDPAGFLALARAEAPATAQGALADPARFEAVARGSIGNAPTTNGRPSDAGSPGFGLILDAPHLRLEANGLLRIAGDVELKLRGSTLRLAATENTTEVRTGPSRDPIVPARGTDRWLTLVLEDADLTLDLRAPADAAVWQATARTFGAPLVLEAALGSLDAGATRYEANAETAELTGSLTATMSPDPSSAQPRVRVDVAGALASSSLAASPAWMPTARAAGPLLGLGALAMVGGAAILVGVRSRKRREVPASLTVEQLVDLAAEAIESGRHQDALDWTLAAQRLSPTSVRLITDEAFLRASLGDVDAALAAYDRAIARNGGGEAAYLASSLLVAQGDVDRAATYVVRALEREPALAFEIADDAEMGALLDRADVIAALGRAYARVRDEV